MKKTIYLIIFILLISIVSATLIPLSGNSLSATLTVKSQCNDNIDNDGDGFIDSLDSDCSNDCNLENGDDIPNGNCV